MAKRGRKPAPTELKILKGTRKDRINAEAPEAISGAPVKPAHLEAEAAAEWDRMVEVLDRMGVLSQADGAALAIYCVAFARWRKARRALGRKGLVLETALGGVKPNPLIAIIAAAEIEMARLLVEFGCTPSSRGRVKTVKPQAKSDALADFLSKKRG